MFISEPLEPAATMFLRRLSLASAFKAVWPAKVRASLSFWLTYTSKDSIRVLPGYCFNRLFWAFLIILRTLYLWLTKMPLTSLIISGFAMISATPTVKPVFTSQLLTTIWMFERMSQHAYWPKSFQVMWIKPPAELPTEPLFMIPAISSPLCTTTAESVRASFLNHEMSPVLSRLMIFGMTRLMIYFPVQSGFGFKTAGIGSPYCRS